MSYRPPLFGTVKIYKPGPSRGVQWRSLSSVGASIGDPFEGAGRNLHFANVHGAETASFPKLVAWT